jgi:sec-independent protein translocase protein TatB
LTPRHGFTIIEYCDGGRWAARREESERSRWALNLGIVEIIVILVVALIVIPPENLPDVMRAAGKVLRELRLASNMVMRELGGALDQAPAERTEPTINTMKPHNTMQPAHVATRANIAQSAASADREVSADSVATPANPSAESGKTAAQSDTSADAPDKHTAQN